MEIDGMAGLVGVLLLDVTPALLNLLYGFSIGERLSLCVSATSL